MRLSDPIFPPVLAGHPVDPSVTPFEHACRRAEDGEFGAADLVWSRAIARAECAIVLEPEVPLARSLQMGPLVQVALADCLGGLMPPQVAIQHRWPDTILVNGAAAGVVRLGAPLIELDEVPDWLVVGTTLQLTHDIPGKEPGEVPGQTALSEEGAGDLTRTEILEGLAAHVLVWINTWSEEGFRPVADQWLHRAEGRESPVALCHHGTSLRGRVLGIDEEAGLLIRIMKNTGTGGVRVLPFLHSTVLFERERARR
jgi:BirA family biotin operon repressor/biotin-[acetyl-CoA-carboxylase] ligase